MGAATLDSLLRRAQNGSPTADCIVSPGNPVTVTHTGGDSIKTSSLHVVLNNGSGSMSEAFPSAVGPTFDTGESAVVGSVNTSTRVLVVTDNTVLCEGTVTSSPS